MTTFLGLDVGTQGLKAVLLEPGRGVVAKASRALTTLPGLPAGHSEQHPADWCEAARGATADLRLAAPAEFDAIAGVGVSGQQHGLVALDDRDHVIRPAILWNDVRCARECDEIVEAVGGRERMFARFGLASLPPGFTAGKLRWVARHEPDLFARVRRVLLPHDYVNLWLTGRAACEAGDASGTGWFDVRRRRFAPELCEATWPGTTELLPQLVAAGDAVGVVRPEVADQLRLRPGTAVAHGAGDNMAAAVGAGAVRAGVAVLSLGTSGTVFAHANDPICDPDGEIAPFCGSTGGWLPLGCTMNATVATETVRGLLGLDLAAFDAAIRASPAGSDGVLCVPFFSGERSPNLPAATGSFLGLTPRNATAPNLGRAAVEGATFALGRLLDRLKSLTVRVDELRLTGGGSNSPAWRAIAAAVAGVPVRAGLDPDAAAVGAAILALWSWRRAHGEGDLDVAAARDALDLDSALVTVPADPAAVAVYAEHRRAWQALVDALSPTYTPAPLS